MRLLVQTVDSAQLSIDGQATASIGQGLVIYVGIALADTAQTAAAAASRCGNARLLPNGDRPFDLSALQAGCPILVVSCFSLYGDLSSGRRPSWSAAASPGEAEPVYDAFVAEITAIGCKISTGSFGAEMVINAANHGPLNLLIEVS